MNQERAGTWPWPVTIVALLAILIAFGVLLDLMAGAQVSQGSRSWIEWLLWMLGLGGLYLILEAAAEWIERRDTVEDPLPKRIWHLALLLAVGVIVWVAGMGLLSIVVRRCCH